MMENYPDRLERNLTKQVDLLERIYQSDKRLIDLLDSDKTGMDLYDEYIKEQDSLMNELDELDSEYDTIYAYISEHKEEVSRIKPDQRSRIRRLTNEVSGKSEAVRDIESRVKQLVSDSIGRSRSGLAESRRNAMVIQKHYRGTNASIEADNTTFDIHN